MEQRIREILLEKKELKTAFELVVEHYQKRLYWHVRRMVHHHEDADDILQNTFVKIWKNLAGFRGDSQLYTWLYRIATNEALGFLDKEKRRKAENFDDVAYQVSGDTHFDENAAAAKLEKAVASLPEKQRLVFNLKYFEEMKYDDMAEVTGTSVGALKASYHHAVAKIKEFITAD